MAGRKTKTLAEQKKEQAKEHVIECARAIYQSARMGASLSSQFNLPLSATPDTCADLMCDLEDALLYLDELK